MADSLHTVFCAECTNNFVWKDAGVFYTHRMLGTKGKITRLLACTEEQRRVYPQKSMDLGPTFVHPNYANNPHNHESSGSYNKPASVMHWVREAKIDETYVLFIDADMLLRSPIEPLRLGASRGMVVSEHVGYLDQGINNHLVENFVPHEGMAKLARAAGWYHIFHLEDLKQIAPRWLHYCEAMRSNPQRYWDMNGSKAQWHPLARRAVGTKNYIPTGDAYVQFGEAPWISEMYGYIFAAAEQGIDTKLLNGLVEYTDYTSAARPPQGPTIIHYGLHCHVDSYHFTKYDYQDFDLGSCPLLFFRAPARPKPSQALCAETINTLNDALCDFYHRSCPGAEQLPCAPHEADTSQPQCIDERDDCAREMEKLGDSKAGVVAGALASSRAAPIANGEAGGAAGAGVAAAALATPEEAAAVERETPLGRWERNHPTEVQLGSELALVLLIGLAALACILVSRRPGFLASQQQRRGKQERAARKREVAV